MLWSSDSLSGEGNRTKLAIERMIRKRYQTLMLGAVIRILNRSILEDLAEGEIHLH
jgi:hypothetical protein